MTEFYAVKKILLPLEKTVRTYCMILFTIHLNYGLVRNNKTTKMPCL